MDLCPVESCGATWQIIGAGPIVLGDVYGCEKHTVNTGTCIRPPTGDVVVPMPAKTGAVRPVVPDSPYALKK